MKFSKTLIVTILFFSLIFIPNITMVQATQTDDSEPVSVILMIGDGMGYEHLKLAKWVEYGKNAINLTMVTELAHSVTTESADSLITDSAAAATAIATGVKTNNNWVSIAPDGTELETILEKAQQDGKSTGIVTTTSLQHGTPAAFMTHTESRSDFSTISQQIVENSGVNVLLGGGRSIFTETQLNFMEEKGYTLVEDRTSMMSITSGNILGLFSEGDIGFEEIRNFTLTPSLAEMTGKALELLSQDSNGFFLMVEGGRIDHAGHDNNKVGVALETIAFDRAVGRAYSYAAQTPNTILIVTADHETGGLMITSDSLNSQLPSLGMTEEAQRTIRISRANSINVTWSTGYHTDANVPLYLHGDFFEQYSLNDIIDNTDVYQIMDDFFSSELQRATPLLTPTRGVIAGGSVVIIVLIAYFIRLRRSNP
ncbi:MAG: alkaline phosphatase [Candidatus Thorarchaeota archaeon]